jgi:asparagine synthase (glutamine-hydrolysing)
VSGGLDSSAVFCVAEHLRRANRLPAPGIAGYTLAFTDDSEANELSYARAVGEYLGIPIHEVAPSIPPLSWYAERARVYREFPGFPNASMFLDIRQQAAAQGSRVMLGGEGGDSWLNSSQVYYAEELAQRHWSTVLDCFRTDAAAFGTRQAMWWLIRHGCLPLLPFPLKRRLRRLVGAASHGACYWLSPRLHEAFTLRRAQSLAQHEPRVQLRGQGKLLALLYYAFGDQVMEKVEREGTHSGVEMRHPLHSSRIVQYAFSTPARLPLRGDWTKVIHRQALQGFMPRVILERKSKAGFSIAFRAHLDRMQETLTETLPRERAAWVSPQGMARLFGSYRNNPQEAMAEWVLWSIYACDELFRCR